MGCGQSKIGTIYLKNKKNKNAKKNDDSIRTTSIEHKSGNGHAKDNKTNNNGTEIDRNADQIGSGDNKTQAIKKSVPPGGGPLLQQTKISTSQLDFFRMLDEKIENGPDYDENVDPSPEADRVAMLMNRWEVASNSWSNVFELQMASPSSLERLGPTSAARHCNITSNMKEREGARNIIGGRPESAPLFVSSIRSANRVDGLQGGHVASPHMPRHVLESITQSPTQSLKNTPPNMSPTCMHYLEYGHHGQDNPRPRGQYSQQVANSSFNGDYVTQQALFREQYIQQTGIMPYADSLSGHVLRNNPYVQQFHISQSPHFSGPRKRDYNAAQMT